MTVADEYERLYITAVDEIIELMRDLEAPLLDGQRSIRKKDLIDRWCKIVKELAPPVHLDLNSEAVEAIRRAHAIAGVK